MRDRAGERRLLRARPATAPEHLRNLALARVAVDDREFGDVLREVPLDLAIPYRQVERVELRMPVERADDGGLHGLASRLSGEREIPCRQPAVDVDGVRRPGRPIDARHLARVALALGDLGAVGPDLLDLQQG